MINSIRERVLLSQKNQLNQNTQNHIDRPRVFCCKNDDNKSVLRFPDAQLQTSFKTQMIHPWLRSFTEKYNFLYLSLPSLANSN